MAKRKSELENEIDDTCESWIAVNKNLDPAQWEAWTAWRKREMRTRLEPENLTVPTMFPPATVAAAKAYLETVRKIRLLVGWKDGTARLTNDPGAWQ